MILQIKEGLTATKEITYQIEHHPYYALVLFIVLLIVGIIYLSKYFQKEIRIERKETSEYKDLLIESQKALIEQKDKSAEKSEKQLKEVIEAMNSNATEIKGLADSIKLLANAA